MKYRTTIEINSNYTATSISREHHYTNVLNFNWDINKLKNSIVLQPIDGKYKLEIYYLNDNWLLLNPTAVYAGDSLTADFINSIYKTVVDSSFEYYNLYSKGTCLQLRPENLEKIETILKTDEISSFFHHIIDEPGKQCEEVNWS